MKSTLPILPGIELNITTIDGEQYVRLDLLCDELGLADPTDEIDLLVEERWAVVGRDDQGHPLIAMRSLFFWLCQIEVHEVKSEHRDAMFSFQMQAAQVLATSHRAQDALHDLFADE